MTNKNLYQGNISKGQLIRFEKLSNQFKEQYESEVSTWFSAPGRTEICGNHTDHNNGLVITASIHLDSIAVAAPNNSNRIQIISEGFDQMAIDLSILTSIKEERETSQSLVRGIASYLKDEGYQISGFSACISSQVFAGSGLSSSASFESLIVAIFNHFFNKDCIDPIKMALAGQYAENHFFGKPCGLMDQLACLWGGIIQIDFRDNRHPILKKINYSFEDNNFQIVIVDTGKSHTDFTEDYAAIPAEMKRIASYFRKKTLRSVDQKEFKKKIPHLINKFKERPLLRAMHYFAENQRVVELFKKLKTGDLFEGLAIIKESGNSSFKLLQNIYSNNDPLSQSLNLALTLSEDFFKKNKRGVCRVHGGGFGGTIQSFVHKNDLRKYMALMEGTFTQQCCTILRIRDTGLKIYQGN